MIEKLLYYISDSHNPYENMALEYALTMNVDESTVILFLWQNQQTVVIGRNQNIWKECYVNHITKSGGRIARRLSGGGAVYHDLGNLNFSFCTQCGNYDLERQMSVVLDAVKAFGADAANSGRNDLVLPDGRKFSGNAFFEKDDYACHHGTLMIDTDIEKVKQYLHVSREKLKSKSVDSVKSRVVNLKEICPQMSVNDMENQLLCSMEQIYGLTVSQMPEDMIDFEFVDGYAKVLASWQWIYGRKMIFTNQVHGKYLWGETDFAFKVKNGIIEDVKIYSDALEQTFILDCEGALKGCKYILDNMEHRLLQCAGKETILLERARDMVKVLAENM